MHTCNGIQFVDELINSFLGGDAVHQVDNSRLLVEQVFVFPSFLPQKVMGDYLQLRPVGRPRDLKEGQGYRVVDFPYLVVPDHEIEEAKEVDCEVFVTGDVKTVLSLGSNGGRNTFIIVVWIWRNIRFSHNNVYH